VTFAITLLPLAQKATAGENHRPATETQILLSTSSSWDGEPYQSYPSGQPELSVLKITLAPHTQPEWHCHPMPSAAYIVAGELTLERKKDGKGERPQPLLSSFATNAILITRSQSGDIGKIRPKGSDSGSRQASRSVFLTELVANLCNSGDF